MIDANAIRNNIETEFKLKFDFAKFDEDLDIQKRIDCIR